MRYASLTAPYAILLVDCGVRGGVEIPAPSLTKATANIVKKSAAAQLKNLNGLSRSKAARKLKSAGFEHKGKTKGGYDKYYHSDGSRVHIRPDREVVRTVKIQNPHPNKAGYNQRVGPDGKATSSHNTGERIKEDD